MSNLHPYKEFTRRFKLLIRKHPCLIAMTLSNIFTMRIIGNKTHGDLAEIAICEFINQCMYDFSATHVGKDLYRAKSKEEDISICNEITNDKIPVSLKAYGDGPLQLSTDKSAQMFARLSKEKDASIRGKNRIQKILADPAFRDLYEINILPLIYDEDHKRCNILIFDYDALRKHTREIKKITTGRGRKHPVYRFFDANDDYICEVRYGAATANALQRGVWTHTINAAKHFNSLTDGWIDYSHNLTLVKLFSYSLVSSVHGHEVALTKIQRDIESIRARKSL